MFCLLVLFDCVFFLLVFACALNLALTDRQTDRQTDYSRACTHGSIAKLFLLSGFVLGYYRGIFCPRERVEA